MPKHGQIDIRTQQVFIAPYFESGRKRDKFSSSSEVKQSHQSDSSEDKFHNLIMKKMKFIRMKVMIAMIS